MIEYIKKADALEIVKRTSGDYAAAFSEIRRLPAADVVPIWWTRSSTIAAGPNVCNDRLFSLWLDHVPCPETVESNGDVPRLVIRTKNAGDVYAALRELGWEPDVAAAFLDRIPDA